MTSSPLLMMLPEVLQQEGEKGSMSPGLRLVAILFLKPN